MAITKKIKIGANSYELASKLSDISKLADDMAVITDATALAAAKTTDVAGAKITEAIITNIGALSSLTTTDKTSVVNAINEVKGSITGSIEDLDYEDTEVAHQFVTAVSEEDGVISVSRAALTADDIPTLTMTKISDAGTAAKANVETLAIADDTTSTALPTSEQVATYVKTKVAGLTGAMHFTYSVTPTEGQTDAEAIAAKYAAESATPEKGDFVIITTNTLEYVFDGTSWVKLGDESSYVTKATTIAGVDLQDNITKTEMLTALNVADGAQVNVIESVKIGDTALTVTDKAVSFNLTSSFDSTTGELTISLA